MGCLCEIIIIGCVDYLFIGFKWEFVINDNWIGWIW